jgi:hypothetical protein
LRAKVDPLEGLWQGYDGEWGHVSRQQIALAEAIPAEKYAWRPAPGVRSTSEVFMHIALANFYLLSVTGPPMPPEIKSNGMEKTVTSKPAVIEWLKRSLDAVKNAHAGIKPSDLQRKVKTENGDGAVGRVCPDERDCAALGRSYRKVGPANQDAFAIRYVRWSFSLTSRSPRDRLFPHKLTLFRACSFQSALRMRTASTGSLGFRLILCFEKACSLTNVSVGLSFFHPSLDEIELYVLKRLPGSLAATISAHLRQCLHCEYTHQQLRRQIEYVRVGILTSMDLPDLGNAYLA